MSVPELEDGSWVMYEGRAHEALADEGIRNTYGVNLRRALPGSSWVVLLDTPRLLVLKAKPGRNDLIQIYIHKDLLR